MTEIERLLEFMEKRKLNRRQIGEYLFPHIKNPRQRMYSIIVEGKSKLPADWEKRIKNALK